MINFEIIQSPDNNVKSSFKYFQNQIYLGRTVGDLWIDDKDLKPYHVMLEVVESELLIHPQKDIGFFQINGKRASTIRKIKINDEITIGKSVIKILGFEETARSSKKEILTTKLNQLIEQNSPRLVVVESLTKLMKS
jgi:hypothetical protein